MSIRENQFPRNFSKLVIQHWSVFSSILGKSGQYLVSILGKIGQYSGQTFFLQTTIVITAIHPLEVEVLFNQAIQSVSRSVHLNSRSTINNDKRTTFEKTDFDFEKSLKSQIIGDKVSENGVLLTFLKAIG